MSEKPTDPKLRRELPEVLKGPAHRDRTQGAKPRLYAEREIDLDARPKPTLPRVRWLERKDIG